MVAPGGGLVDGATHRHAVGTRCADDGAVASTAPAAGTDLLRSGLSQFTGHEWQAFLAQHQMLCSMSQRGNCHDKAVAKSFVQQLKRERLRRQIYATREDAGSDVFHYIEMLYNPTRRHSNNDGLSPAAFEQRHSHGRKGV